MTENKKDSCQSWIYLSFVSLITFFVFGFLDAYGVLLVFLVRHFDEKNSKAAWLGSSAMFGCFFLYPFALRMRYKYGIRSTVLFAGALMLPVFIFSPMVPRMELLFLTFSVPLAVSCSSIACASYTTIREYFERYQGLAFGIRAGANALGTVMFSFVLPILLSDIKWQRTFWILSGISFLTICYALVYSDSGRSEEYPSDRVIHSVSTVISVPAKDFSRNDMFIYWRLLKNKHCLVFLAAHTVFVIVVFMPPVFMVQFATKGGHDISISKWLMIVRGIVAVITRFMAGRLGDCACRRRKVRLICLTVMTLFSIATLCCSISSSFVLMMCYMALVSVIDSTYWVTFPLLVNEVVCGVFSEHAFALFSCVGSFATLAGPPFLGWLYDFSGDSSPVMFTVSAVSAVSAFLAAVGLYIFRDSSLSMRISEDLSNEVFLPDHDYPTQSTLVYIPEVDMQYVTVV